MTKKIGYSKTYPILNIGVWEKIWIEEEVPAEMDSRTVLYGLKKQVESFHFESNKADEKKAQQELEERRNKGITAHEYSVIAKAPIEDQIKSCNEIKVLESYKFIVKGKPELEQVYNNRLKELT